MYEDEFELTFNLSGEEPQPEQAAQEPPVPPKPKAAAPVVDEPTRVMVLEKPQPAPQPEMPEPVQEEPEKTPAPTVQAAANGRCVLISGGDRGIGAAAARAFYAAGYRVAVLYHSNAKAAAELEKQLPGITAVQCDVASRASCELAFRTAEQALGRVDVLVSNAGIAQQKLFTDITPEEWQHMLDVNLTGAFHLCQLALPGMIRRKAGRILTVSSMWGHSSGVMSVNSFCWAMPALLTSTSTWPSACSAVRNASSQLARDATSHCTAVMPGSCFSSAAAASALLWYSTATRKPAS